MSDDDTIPDPSARPSMRDTVEAVTAPSRWTLASESLRPLRLDPGAELGRYVILKLLGEGGMGAVYAAYDPKLDRRVALKLIRPSSRGSVGAAAELVREAQALARVVHPNVVAVHDVGVVGDLVFIEMEFVQGETLEAFCEGRPPDEILRAYRQAGEALAAAHDAGLVHRDFKPTNAVVDGTGRVRVIDFGIARPVEEDDGAPPPAPTSSPEIVRAMPSSRPLGVTVSAPSRDRGAVIGTPAYMAPEQWLGREVDARADQYAFAASLFESLYGRLPFPDASRATMASADARGPVPARPEVTEAPAYVHAVVARALAYEPSARHPSMRALLDALGRDPRAALRRRASLVAAAVVSVTLVALAARGLTRRRDPCLDVRDRLADVWDESRRARAKEAFLATKSPAAEAAFDRVRDKLDAYADAWARRRVAVCRGMTAAAHEDDAESGEQIVCLDWRLRELRALSNILVDRPDVHAAVEASSRLVPVDRCASPGRRRGPRPPEDPRVRALTERASDLAAEALAKRIGGRPKDAIAPARAAVEVAKESAHAPTVALALYAEGQAAIENGDYAGAARALEDAVWAAEEGGDDARVVDAAGRMARVQGYHLQRYAEATQWERLARAALKRIGEPDEATAELDDDLAAILRRKKESERAVELSRKVVELRTKVFGSTHANVARAQHNLANGLLADGHIEEAEALYTRAHQTFETDLGPSHPSCAKTVVSLAILKRRAGDLDAAVARYDQAIGIFEAAYGPGHAEIATAKYNMSIALLAAGRLDRARRALEDAAEIRTRVFGPNHPSVARVLGARAIVDRREGRYDDARDALERAIKIEEGAAGEGAAVVAPYHASLARVALAEGDAKRAIEHAEEAATIERKHLRADHPSRGPTLALLARCHLAAGDAKRALPLVAQARALTKEAEPKDVADVEIVAFMALRATGGDPKEARALLEHATKTFEDDDDNAAEELAEARRLRGESAAWLGVR